MLLPILFKQFSENSFHGVFHVFQSVFHFVNINETLAAYCSFFAFIFNVLKLFFRFITAFVGSFLIPLNSFIQVFYDTFAMLIAIAYVNHGIYYTDTNDLPIINKVMSEQQTKISGKIAVEVMPLQNFYTAEDYHQDYLEKNPDGYCHLPVELFEWVKRQKM